MTKSNSSFEDWFEILQMEMQRVGYSFNDQDAVREDYDAGKDVYDVIDEVKAEYGVS